MELQDKIGRQPLVDKIKYLIDTLPQDKHFCLALDGEWGSGKTFVMEMLRKSLREHSEYIVINYDAWKNNFYSDPLIAILYCLLDGIKEYIGILPETKEKLKKGVLKSIKSFGKDALSAMKDSGGKVALFAHIIEGIANIVMQSGKLENHQKIADFQSYQSLLDEVKIQLNNITKEEIYEGKQTKLVIMVDEIDRCLPHEQLLVLERLHHLFDVHNCAVIVALNKKAIHAVFDRQYGGDGREYLRKFFSYNFVVETECSIFLRNLITDFVDEVNNSNKQNDAYSADDIEPLICALLYEFRKISFGKKYPYNNRDIQNYFDKFYKIWKTDKPVHIAYIGFLLFMVFYKQYDEAHFQAYKGGNWDGQLEIFEFGNVVSNVGEHLFPYKSIEVRCPIYNNSFCNQFVVLMNSVRFRNEINLLHWLQSLNGMSNTRLFDVKGKGSALFEGWLAKIDNYGMMLYENNNEKQRN